MIKRFQVALLIETANGLADQQHDPTKLPVFA